MSASILVTGAAGYLGSALVKNLLSAGHCVYAVDNLRHGFPSLLQFIADPLFTFHNLDVRVQSTELTRLLSKADFYFPLAALVGQKICEENSAEAWDVNCNIIDEHVEQLNKYCTVIFPNTNSGYGTSGEEICTEESPLEPVSIYGKSKVHAEAQWLYQWPQTIVFRLATVFGIGETSRPRLDLLVNQLFMEAKRKRHLNIYQPEVRRNFVHINDVIDAFTHAMSFSDKMLGQIYNVGNDELNTTKAGLVQKIAKYTKCTYNIVEGEDMDKRDYYVSNQKLKDAGFTPYYNFEHGFLELDQFAKMYNAGLDKYFRN